MLRALQNHRSVIAIAVFLLSAFDAVQTLQLVKAYGIEAETAPAMAHVMLSLSVDSAIYIKMIFTAFFCMTIYYSWNKRMYVRDVSVSVLLIYALVSLKHIANTAYMEMVL